MAFDGHAVVADLPEALLLIIFGCAVGLIGTLIGAGGGFIHVPVLMVFFGFSPQMAIGTSITAVFMNALSGTLSYVTHKRIDYELGIKFATVAVPGVIIGAIISQNFTFTSFSILFSIILITLSLHFFAEQDITIVQTRALESPKERQLYDSDGELHSYAPDMGIGMAGSFFIGIFSGLFGIGGGILHVPLMCSVLGMPVHVVTATSHFILAITSFIAVIIFTGMHEIDFDFAVLIGIGAILGAYFGAYISLKTSPRLIKVLIAICLLLLALKLISGVM
ncbi:MAG: sulfite exporter TauE/SafE family protein [Desulfobulbaceae bacterium]|nr:sulfite exporter TauE/SafE family protein [Desulfobulbaceae bacterium]HIJ90565.1 sulfite exporter TauE/SafE family protein [Deltaproteobacteria bacterium]